MGGGVLRGLNVGLASCQSYFPEQVGLHIQTQQQESVQRDHFLVHRILVYVVVGSWGAASISPL